MFVEFRRAGFFLHCTFDAALNLLGFTAQHGGLVRHADGSQVDVGIKPLRIVAFKFFQKFLFITAVENVVTNVIGFLEVEDDKIVAAAIGARL